MSADDRAVSRLALGTAQLGMRYGVANRLGQPPQERAVAILERAIRGGIRCLDTATRYGDAEGVIGLFLSDRAPRPPVSVVTKLGAEDAGDGAAVRAAVAASSVRLGAPPAAVLLHDPALLARWRDGIGGALRACKDEGRTSAIGVSVYDPEQFAAALELPGLDVVQAPANVIDRRIERRELLVRAHDSGVRVMLRSPFLQGLLVLEPERYPAWLGRAAVPLHRWWKLCARYRVEPATVALRFVLERTAPAVVVVGCESEEQLDGLLDAANGPDLPRDLVAELETLATEDEKLVDPTGWPT